MNRPLVHWNGKAVCMLENGIDTDVIFPARFLLEMERAGLGRFLFADRREQHNNVFGRPFPFPFEEGNRPSIILAGNSFGSGSSREHAVWALVDYGIRAVIAPSFGEIFASNAARNGLAPLVLDAESIGQLACQVDDGQFSIDLEKKMICSPSGMRRSVHLPEQDRLSLINGWDEIDMITAMHGDEIDTFERDYRKRMSWAVR